MKHRQSTRATLELHSPELPLRIIKLEGADLQIGRAPGQEIHLDDARVSRHHARIEHRPDGSLFIVDLDSKSSTKLDGRRLVPFQPVPLHDGSRISIIEYELIVRDPGGSSPDRHDDGPTILESQSLDDVSIAQVAHPTALSRCTRRDP